MAVPPWRKHLPLVLMTLAQLGYTILYFLTEAAFNKGLSPYVYITYRHVLAAAVMLPPAYFLEKKERPSMSLALFVEIFVLSVLGVSLTLNMYFASLKYTSPAFITSFVNTVPALTFMIATFLRMEQVNAKSLRGMAKILGTVVSLAGVTMMTLYEGPAIRSSWKAAISLESSTVHQDWVKGSIFVVISCIAWSFWYIMQAMTLKRYPAQLSLTAWMALLGGAQSAMFTAIVERRRPEAWAVGLDIRLWSIIYCGIVASGVIIYVQLWCTEAKGPVFVTMFNPVSTIMVAVLAYFMFGEKLYTGSMVGGIIVIAGLYMLLWGKEKDNEAGTDQEAKQSGANDGPIQEKV